MNDRVVVIAWLAKHQLDLFGRGMLWLSSVDQERSTNEVLPK